MAEPARVPNHHVLAIDGPRAAHHVGDVVFGAGATGRYVRRVIVEREQVTAVVTAHPQLARGPRLVCGDHSVPKAAEVGDQLVTDGTPIRVDGRFVVDAPARV